MQQPEVLETKVEYNLERKEQVLNISTTGSTVNVMEVTYEFDSPEKSFGKETRIFEISLRSLQLVTNEANHSREIKRRL